ncbi:Homeodomain-like domain-containing protein [Streptomyces pini]|uniref:Homeodomain-like domain-containing protein n=1 Tax=Streptomyces pini TaxID=1520580 RepID=A0A1I4C1W4_9ACTN|nr:Homeodomain-like domain-containing protein [Streptomyces pini]
MAEAVQAVRAIENPTRRAQAISELLKQQAEQGPLLREERSRIVHAMRDEGTSLRKIAAAIGVSLGTVQDILRGHSGPWGNRQKPPSADDE